MNVCRVIEMLLGGTHVAQLPSAADLCHTTSSRLSSYRGVYRGVVTTTRWLYCSVATTAANDLYLLRLKDRQTYREREINWAIKRGDEGRLQNFFEDSQCRKVFHFWFVSSSSSNTEFKEYCRSSNDCRLYAHVCNSAKQWCECAEGYRPDVRNKTCLGGE